jgi:hypothetical protein
LESIELARLDVPWLSPIIHVNDRSSQKAGSFEQIVIPQLNFASTFFSSFSILFESGDLSRFRLPDHHGDIQRFVFVTGDVSCR